MEGNLSMIIFGGAIFLILGALILVAFVKRQSARSKSDKLRQEFGPEYDRVVTNAGERAEAEEELVRRLERVEKFELHALDHEEADYFVRKWDDLQKDFVEDPGSAVEAANQLISQVMSARGYPMAEFDQRAADISVHYPEVVGHFRSAHSILEKHRASGASTEQLRQAMVHHKIMFEELLITLPDPKANGSPAADAEPKVREKVSEPEMTEEY